MLDDVHAENIVSYVGRDYKETVAEFVFEEEFYVKNPFGWDSAPVWGYEAGFCVNLGSNTIIAFEELKSL